MVNRYFDIFKSHQECVSFAPADEKQLKESNRWLLSHGFSEIPDEYKSFLQLTNGFTFNGIEFYGTVPHPRPEKDYIFPDLVSVNKYYLNYDFFNSKIVIGRLSENILLYDSKLKCYAFTDRINLRSRIEFESFTQMLDRFVEKLERVI